MEDQAILATYSKLKGDYTSYHTYMQTLHDYFFVTSDNINREYSFGTELNHDVIWDATSLDAVKVAVAGVHSFLIPSNKRWFDFGMQNRRYSYGYETRRWLSDVAEETFYVLSKTNFDQQADGFFASSFVYGTAVMFSEEDNEDDIRFLNVPIKDVFLVEDAKGRVAEYYIRHMYTPLQAIDQFGEKNVPAEQLEEYNKNHYSNKKYEYVHAVGKRRFFDPRKKDKLNMEWSSKWIDVNSKKKVAEGGYLENPFGVHRFYKRGMFAMGFSPCMDSLPFARTLNTIVETNLVGAQTVIRPPLDVPDQGYITQFNLNPGALNIRSSAVGKDDRIQPLITGASPQIGVEFQNLYRQDLRQALFNDIFTAFADITKQMTVPEVREKINEKMSMLGPAVGRFQTEFLENVITRTVNILMRRGRLPLPPQELVEAGRYEIEYISPLALAQKSNDIQAIQEITAYAGNMSEIFPTMVDKIKSDVVIDVLAKNRGVPMEVIHSDDEVNLIRKTRMEAQEQAAQLQAAQAAAETINTGASAERQLAQADRARS